MALLDITYTTSDFMVLELTGDNSPIADIVFNKPSVLEVSGTNGTANDIVFGVPVVNEIPRILVTDFAFI